MKYLIVGLMSTFLLLGCATPRLSNSETSAVVESFIEEQSLESKHSVSAFRLDTWGQLNDEYIVFRSSPSRHYLIKLMPRCNDLNYAPGIAVFRRFGNTLSEGMDYVYVPDSISFKCYINKIYPMSKEQYQTLQDNIKAEVKELKVKEEAAENASTE